jgi:hypothetical protein
MVTLLKYGVIIIVWVGAFSLGYSQFNSKAEEEVLRLKQSLTRTEEYQSYIASQKILTDGEQQLEIQSFIHQEPYQVYILSTAKLTETEDFEFEMYFEPDVLYIHTLATDYWNKADYTHPVAGEVEGLKSPLDFWLRLLPRISNLQVIPNNDGQTLLYRAELQQFRDEIHGIRLEDVETAIWEVWTSPELLGVVKMKLDLQFKPNFIRGYDKITYFIEFSEPNNAPLKALPQEAQKAERLS